MIEENEKQQMRDNEIIEGNKLIAEFMGAIRHHSGTWDGKSISIKFPDGKICTLEQLSYNSNWNWIMPVIEKIEQDNYGFKMCRKVVEIYLDDTKDVILKEKKSSRIESLWVALVEFIKRHNSGIVVKEGKSGA